MYLWQSDDFAEQEFIRSGKQHVRRIVVNVLTWLVFGAVAVLGGLLIVR